MKISQSDPGIKGSALLSAQKNEQEPYLDVCFKTGKSLVSGICLVCRRRCYRAGRTAEPGAASS